MQIDLSFVSLKHDFALAQIKISNLTPLTWILNTDRFIRTFAIDKSKDLFIHHDFFLEVEYKATFLLESKHENLFYEICNSVEHSILNLKHEHPEIRELARNMLIVHKNKDKQND